MESGKHQAAGFTQARELVTNAGHILIGAGAGLSTAAGLAYSGERFEENFSAYIAKYGMTDMYSAGFYPFESDEARWGYWARHVWFNRLDPPALPLYQRIISDLAGKDMFVVTTNVDAQFRKAGFDPTRIFEPQGDYGLMQCARGCHQRNYPLADIVPKMVKATDQETLCIPSDMVPKCPVCGGAMVVHVRVDGTFVEDGEWRAAARRYMDFVDGVCDGNTLLLELGVGWNTPVWIRYPFERLVRDRGCALVRMNYGDASVDDLGNGSVGVEGDIARTWPIVCPAGAE